MSAAPSISKTLSSPARLAAGIDGSGLTKKTNGRAVADVPRSIPACAVSIATAPVQAPSTVFINIRRPLMSVWGVALLLNQSEEFVETAVEDGRLAWAFNISGPGSHTRCVRVFTRCVLDCCASVKNSYTAPFVLNAIFPEARAKFHTHEIAYAWHCGVDQIRLLAEKGVLKKLPGGPRRGPNSVVYFSRAVLADFLTSRRIT